MTTAEMDKGTKKREVKYSVTTVTCNLTNCEPCNLEIREPYNSSCCLISSLVSSIFDYMYAIQTLYRDKLSSLKAMFIAHNISFFMH